MMGRPRVVMVAASVLLIGCSPQEDALPGPSPADKPRQPLLSLAIESPADRRDLKPNSPFDIVCTVEVVEPDEFEPMVVAFQLSDPAKKRSKKANEGKWILATFSVDERKQEVGKYTFQGHFSSPREPGRYAVDARVTGKDRKRFKPGVFWDFDAPTMEIEVKK